MAEVVLAPERYRASRRSKSPDIGRFEVERRPSSPARVETVTRPLCQLVTHSAAVVTAAEQLSPRPCTELAECVMGWLRKRRDDRSQAALRREERDRQVRCGQVSYFDMTVSEQELRLTEVQNGAIARIESLAARLELPVVSLVRSIYGPLSDDNVLPNRVSAEAMATILRPHLGGSPELIDASVLRELRKPFDLFGSRRDEDLLVGWEGNIVKPIDRFEQLISGRGKDAVVVGDWRMAEEVVARWMRRNGWPEAELTANGQDFGIDVIAGNAVAQVKWFPRARVGRPAIQQLRGAAGPHRDALFFACNEGGDGRAYSYEALEWSTLHDVSLFTVDQFGQVHTVE